MQSYSFFCEEYMRVCVCAQHSYHRQFVIIITLWKMAHAILRARLLRASYNWLPLRF